MSRVGDVGVSVKDLEQIIEVDFLYGSRQQQLQRTGRLMHSEEAERHDIIMTEQEVRDYGKRIWALQEKGFTTQRPLAKESWIAGAVNLLPETRVES
jgi:hypothetical protein